MKLLVIISVILATAYASKLERITGGVPVEITQVPYQVALLKKDLSTGIFVHECSGSIISSTVVLTTAFCVEETAASRWKIRAASTYHNSGGQVIDVAKYIMHPEYHNRNLYNNIALVHLKSPIIFSQSATPVHLPYPGQTVPDNSMSLISGWGGTKVGDDHRDRLYQATVPIVNQERCNSIYTSVNHRPITEDSICAGWLGVGGQDTCSGDDGAPLVVNKVLIGLSSGGIGCGRLEYPGIYTRVPVFISWINNNMQKLSNN